jgi:hypothetical protein
LRGPRNRSGRLRKISPPLGFDLQTVQPVARRYSCTWTWHLLRKQNTCHVNVRIDCDRKWNIGQIREM